MSNPFNVDVSDSQLTAGRSWTPEVALACLLRDWGIMERGFHLGIPEMSRSVSTGSFQSFSTGLPIHLPADADFGDTGISLTWRIGVYVEVKVSGGSQTSFRIDATNADTYGDAVGVTSASYTEEHLWCQGSVWPPSSVVLQAKDDDVDPAYTVYVKRDWDDNAADCYFQIDVTG